MAKQYKCIKQLVLDYYESDGFCTDETMTIEAGEIFEANNRYPYNIVCGNDCIHLENDDGRWLEIYPDTLSEHFVEVVDNA